MCLKVLASRSQHIFPVIFYAKFWVISLCGMLWLLLGVRSYFVLIHLGTDIPAEVLSLHSRQAA